MRENRTTKTPNPDAFHAVYRSVLFGYIQNYFMNLVLHKIEIFTVQKQRTRSLENFFSYIERPKIVRCLAP